jgi:hypothetical protein
MNIYLLSYSAIWNLRKNWDFRKVMNWKILWGTMSYDAIENSNPFQNADLTNLKIVKIKNLTIDE